MAGPLGLGGMLGGGFGAGSAQLGFLGQEKEDSYVVDEVSLIEGQREKAMQRAQNLTPVAEAIPEYRPANVRDAFTSTGDELLNPEITKDTAWWKKALSKLEPLKYLDIPIELIAEAAIDPISMATGSQLSPLRGSADREQFEAWKALFGNTDIVEGEGWLSELKGRADIAAGAFEKRPLKMQLGLGLAQIIATGGAGALAKGAAMSASTGSKAVLATKALRVGAAIVDPWEIPFRAVGAGRRAFKGASTKNLKAPDPSGASVPPAEEIAEKARASAKEIQDATKYSDLEDLIDSKDIFNHTRENPRYSVDRGINNIRMDGWIRNDTILKRTFELSGTKSDDVLHPILERGNEIRNFIQDRLRAGQDALASMDVDTAVTEFGEMAAVQLQLNTAARPFEIGRLTGNQLFGRGGFLDTGMLTLKTAQGLTRSVAPVDAVEALTSVRLFREALRRAGKLDGIMEDGAFRFGATKKASPTELIKNILKRHEGEYPDFADIEAYDIRRQKATEMFLEGWEPIDIQRLLGHSSIDVTKNYMKATAFTGRDIYSSKRINQLEAGDIGEELTGSDLEKYNTDLDTVVKSVQENKKAGANRTKVKGYGKNEAEYDRFSIIEGERYLNTPAGQELAISWANKSGLDNALGALQEGDEVIDGSIYEIAVKITALQGLREMAMEMKHGFDAITFQRGAITKTQQLENMKRVALEGGTLTNNPAMLQRAGFAKLTEKEGGGLQWLARSSNEKVKKVWQDRFQKFAIESGLGKHLGNNLSDSSVVKNWENWAKAMDEEYIANGNQLAATMVDGRAKHLMLLNYVDLKAWELYRDWIALEGMNKGVYRNLEDLPHVGVAKLALQRQIDQMRFNPVGLMARDEAMKKSYHAGYGAGKAQFLKLAKASNTLDGTAPDTGVFFKNGNPRKNWGDSQLSLLGEWLAEPDVKALFIASRINASSGVPAIRRAVRSIAKNNPALFGEGYTKFLGKTQGTKATEEWVNQLADRIANNRHLWEGIDNLQRYNYDELTRRLKSVDPGRKRLDFVPDSVNGVTSELVAGTLLTVRNMVEKIKGPDVLKFYHKDTLIGKAVRGIYVPLQTALKGGQASMARPIAKAVGARARLYHDAGRQGVVVQVHSQRLAEDALGLKADEANTAMQLAGITEGQEFFTKLVPQSAESIQAYEAGAEALRKYKNLGTPFRKLQGISREGTAGTERVLSDSQALKYLTQVDVVMERINPEDWDKYFDLSIQQKETLAHLKDIMFQVDEQARIRGVDIVGTIQDKGGEYLTNYMPRLYRRGTYGTLERSRAKGGNQSVLNSYATFFEPREQKDILDVLAQGMESGVTSNMNRLSATVLESFSARMGQYTETMWKTAIDTETADFLVSHPALDMAKGSKFSSEVKDLNNLERVLNERIATEGVIDAERIAQLANSDVILDGQPIHRLADVLKKEGNSSLANARKIRNGIMEKIVRRREAITEKWSTTAGKELDGIDWLPSSLSSLDVADQRVLREHLTVVSGLWSPVAKIAEVLQTPTRYMRYFKASMDFGAPLIHGFNALVRMPSLTKVAKGDLKGALASQNAWLKGVGMMGKFFFSPDTYNDYLRNPGNMVVMDEAKNFIRLGHAEPLVGMDNADLLNATRKYVKTKMEPIFGKNASFLQRFEDSFTGYLDVIRTELWKGMKPTIDDQLRKNGVTELTIDNPLVREYYTDLGTVINKMTGVYDPELSLRTPFQGLIENSLLFFAPIYRRATYGIIGDLGMKVATGGKQDKTGLKWRNATQQLSGVIMAGLLMQELAEATGNTRGDAFDTTQDLQAVDENGRFALDLSARFGKLHTNGVQLGIGTAWWTAFRMASDVAMHSTDNTTLSKQDDNPAWNDHWAFRMLHQRGRSQLAPGTAMGYDLITGRTFTGDPLRDGTENDWAAILARVGQSGVPFWLDGALSNASFSQVGVSTTAEFFGLQSYEISSYDKLTNARIHALRNWDNHEAKEWRNDRMKKNQTVSWLYAPETVKHLIDHEHPTVSTLLADHREKYGAKAFGDAKLFREYNELKANATLSAVQHMAIASQDFESGDINGRELQARINQAKFIRFETNRDLLGMERFASIAQYFTDLRANAESADDVGHEFVGDMVYQKWAAVAFQDKFLDTQTGEYMWEARRAEEDAFWADGNNMLFKEYVDKRKNEWLRELPTINAFENAKNALRDAGYWDIEERIWPNDDKMRDDAKKFLSHTRERREQLKDSNPIFHHIEKRVANERLIIRTTNKDIDRILVTWYGNKPRHSANYNLERNLLAIRTSGKTVTPNPSDYSVSPTGIITSKLTGVQ